MIQFGTMFGLRRFSEGGRVGTVVSHWYAFPRENIPLRHNPIVSSMIPLIVFYAYFLMK